MARNAIPIIESKETFVAKRFRIPSKLNAELSDFIEFYEEQAGKKPEENAVIVAILREYFSDNTAFQKFLKSKEKAGGSGSKESKKVA